MTLLRQSHRHHVSWPGGDRLQSSRGSAVAHSRLGPGSDPVRPRRHGSSARFREDNRRVRHHRTDGRDVPVFTREADASFTQLLRTSLPQGFRRRHLAHQGLGAVARRQSRQPTMPYRHASSFPVPGGAPSRSPTVVASRSPAEVQSRAPPAVSPGCGLSRQARRRRRRRQHRQAIQAVQQRNVYLHDRDIATMSAAVFNSAIDRVIRDLSKQVLQDHPVGPNSCPHRMAVKEAVRRALLQRLHTAISTCLNKDTGRSAVFANVTSAPDRSAPEPRRVRFPDSWQTAF
jgi:hypothetical protein